MRNLKRALSLALASVMLVGMMVVGTSAASFSDVDSNDNTEAIEVLKTVGVMNGYDDGGFHPDANVTRNQMAMIICSLLGLDGADYKDYRPFTDVPEWAVGAVGACYAFDIVGGRGEGIYDGDAYVTGVEAAAMMLRALGYTEMEASANWETPIVQKAAEIQLFKGVGAANSGSYMNRNAVAQLTLNALKADVVTTKKTGGTITTSDGTVVDMGNIDYIKVAVPAGVGYNGENDSIQQLAEKLYDGKLTLKPGDGDDMGRPADEWKYNGKSIVKVAKTASTTIVVEKDKALVDLLKDDNKDYYVTTDGDLAYGKFTTTDKNLYVNGTATAGTSAADFFKVGDTVEIFVDKDDADKITNVVVTRYTLAKIDKVDTNVSSSDAKDGVSCKLTLKSASGSAMGTFKDTDVAGYGADYTKDTYVAVVVKGSKVLDSYIVEPVAEGKVSAYKTDVEYTIDGSKYKTAKAFFSSNSGWNEDDFTGIYAAYTDKNGYLIGIVEVEAGKSATDAVYVAKLWADSTSASYGAKVITFYAQVVDMDGKSENVVIGRTNESGEIIGVGIIDDGKGYTFSEKTAIANGKYYVATDGTLKASAGDASSVTDEVADVGYTKSATAVVDVNKLYTMDENEDDKYTEMTAYTDKVGAATIGNNTEVKVDATKLGSYYLDGETKYIVVEKSGADLKVTVKTGGLGYKNTTGGDVAATVVYRTSGRSEIADYVILSVADFSTADSDEMLYIDSVGGKTSNGYMYTVYMPDGSKEEIEAKHTGVALTAKKFYTFSEDDKGLYKLTLASGSNVIPKLDSNADWDGANGNHTGVAYDAVFENYLNDRLTLDKVGAADGATLSEIKAAGAVVIDLHETDNDEYNTPGTETYSGTVNDLDAINGLDAAYTVTMDVNIDKDGVVIVFVTDIAKSTVAAKTQITSIAFDSYTMATDGNAIANPTCTTDTVDVAYAWKNKTDNSDVSAGTNAASGKTYTLTATVTVKDAKKDTHELGTLEAPTLDGVKGAVADNVITFEFAVS